MDTGTAPVCPACGFRIFNRRFPRCESCNAELPDSLVYDNVERHALLAADEARDLERARNDRPLATPAAGSLDESILQGVVGLTDR